MSEKILKMRKISNFNSAIRQNNAAIAGSNLEKRPYIVAELPKKQKITNTGTNPRQKKIGLLSEKFGEVR